MQHDAQQQVPTRTAEAVERRADHRGHHHLTDRERDALAEDRVRQVEQPEQRRRHQPGTSFVDQAPRTDEQVADGDKTLGFNERTGLRPLILAGLVEPAIDTRSRFDDWIAEHGLSRGDIKAVAFKVWALTNGVNAVDPKSLPPLPIRDVEQT